MPLPLDPPVAVTTCRVFRLTGTVALQALQPISIGTARDPRHWLVLKLVQVRLNGVQLSDTNPVTLPIMGPGVLVLRAQVSIVTVTRLCLPNIGVDASTVKVTLRCPEARTAVT